MLYMKDWEVCAPPGFSLGFEGDNGVTVLEVSTDLTEEWDLKVDVGIFPALIGVPDRT